MEKNCKRWPIWHVEIFPFWRPFYLTPFFFKSEDTNRDEGWEGVRYSITWLIFTLAVERTSKIKTGKAGFIQ